MEFSAIGIPSQILYRKWRSSSREGKTKAHRPPRRTDRRTEVQARQPNEQSSLRRNFAVILFGLRERASLLLWLCCAGPSVASCCGPPRRRIIDTMHLYNKNIEVSAQAKMPKRRKTPILPTLVPLEWYDYDFFVKEFFGIASYLQGLLDTGHLHI